MKTRILIADDHAVLRAGLKLILRDGLPDAEIGEAGNTPEAIAQLHQNPWHALVLDLSMPGRNGFEVLSEVRAKIPNLPVLVLSSMPEDQIGLRAIKAGAAGFLNKQSAPEQVVDALKALLAGGQYFSAELSRQMVSELRRDHSQPRHTTLTDRELEVCRLSVAGKSVKEVAAELRLSPKTISTFRLRSFEKLGVRNDIELSRYLDQHGLA